MMDPTGLPAPQSFAFATTDLDEVRALCWSYYYPISVDLLRCPEPLAFSLRVLRIGPLTIGDVTCGTEVRMAIPDLVCAYHINLPLSGHVESEHRGRRVLVDAGRAATYQPVGQTLLRRRSADCRQICVKIDRSALEGQLEAVLDRPARVPLDLAAGFDMTGGPGLSWRRLVMLMASEMDNRDGLLYQPMVAERLGHSLVSGLLLAVDHPYRDELLRPVPPSRPRTVRHAIDAMEADPSLAFTATGLAELAGVSVRTLQEGFRRHVGMAPMAYLRRLRLQRVHEELYRADPQEVTVAEVASRWGFLHLGRFAQAYRAKYGMRPSTTLRALP